MKSTMHESQRPLHDFSGYPAVVARLKKAGLIREDGAPHTGRIIKFPEPEPVSREVTKVSKEEKPKRICAWCGSRHKPLPDGVCARCGRPYPIGNWQS